MFSFARVISYFFKKSYNLTMTVMIGILAGSLNKLWPWKLILSVLDKDTGLTRDKAGGKLWIVAIALLAVVVVVLNLLVFQLVQSQQDATANREMALERRELAVQALELAVQALEEMNVRGEVQLVISGGIRTGADVAKAIAAASD